MAALVVGHAWTSSVVSPEHLLASAPFVALLPTWGPLLTFMNWASGTLAVAQSRKRSLASSCSVSARCCASARCALQHSTAAPGPTQ